MGKLSSEFREPNRKDKVTGFPSVSYARQLGYTLASHLKHFKDLSNNLAANPNLRS